MKKFYQKKFGNVYHNEISSFDFTLHLEDCNAVDFFRFIASLKVKNSGDIFENCNFFLKKLNPAICDWIAMLVNQCFLTGNFPEILKTSKIIPIYKTGKANDVNNYRPISIIPALAENFEKILFSRSNQFLTKFKLLNPNQFGFRNKKVQLMLF